jgi:hypothetical protein
MQMTIEKNLLAADRTGIDRCNSRYSLVHSSKSTLALATLFVLALWAQAQERKPQITGRVVQAGNGSPVECASITLEPPLATGNPHFEAATTDSNGAYYFDRVENGTYTIVASADGFVSKTYNRDESEEGVFNRLDASTKLRNVDFHLNREAVIRGVVTDGEGKPVANVGMGAVKKDQRAKELGYSDAFSWTRTNANGQFVLNKLPAGTYLVSVNGPAGYGANPDRGGWYHETWYPQAQSWKEAEPITLKEGDERNGLEISVEREKRYQIIIWPSGPEGGPKPDDYEIHLEHRNFGCERDADGSYVIPGIPPGHYALTILARSKMHYFGSGETIFDVTDADVTLHLEAGGFGRVRGSVKWAGPAVTLPEGGLFTIESEFAARMVTVDVHGRFDVSDLLPGKYQFRPLQGSPVAIVQVQAVQCAGKEVTDDLPLQIGGGQEVPECEVTLAKR